jgi:hypothetical protein
VAEHDAESAFCRKAVRSKWSMEVVNGQPAADTLTQKIKFDFVAQLKITIHH